jgi:hypothetical protein
MVVLHFVVYLTTTSVTQDYTREDTDSEMLDRNMSETNYDYAGADQQ